jgi:hypothetical protein
VDTKSRRKKEGRRREEERRVTMGHAVRMETMRKEEGR